MAAAMDLEKLDAALSILGYTLLAAILAAAALYWWATR